MHIDTGLRKVLEQPFIYQSFQTIVGADKLYRHFVENVLCPKKGEYILDIGCGPGKILDYMPPDINYTGIDLNEQYILKAKEKYESRGTFICGKLDSDFKFDGRSKYHKIFAFALVHHLSDEVLSETISQVPDLLHKKGVFLTVDPTYSKEQNSIARWIISKDRGQNVKSPNEYRDFVSKYFPNVENIVLENFINIPYSHCIIKATV